MKRFRHLAGDAQTAAFQLPGFCQWWRVVDFEPWGFIPNGANQLLEPPTVRVNEKDPISIYSFVHYARDVGTFDTLELTGNIEIEAGEQGDVAPGPLLQPKLEIPFQWLAYPNNVLTVIPLPKLIQKVALTFWGNNTGGPPQLTVIQVFPCFMNAGTQQGAATVWRNGGAWNKKDNLILPIGGLGNPLCPLFSYVSPPAIPALLLNLMPNTPPVNDAANSVYVRAWCPVPALAVLVTTNDASNPIIQAHFTTN